jgi:small subunit ribosomal protein S11
MHAQVGFKNARKSLPVAAEKAADELARRALALGYASVIVKMKGTGSNKQVAVQSLHTAGLRIKTILEATGIPYNGCRASKRRRV